MLTRQNFAGIQLPTIHEYIDVLNSRINANIEKTNNWQSSVSHLRTYLNSHNITDVNRESINNYIDERLNVNIYVNEFFDTLEDDELIVFSRLALQIPENCKQNKNYDKK